jgi:hypothetical protein
MSLLRSSLILNFFTTNIRLLRSRFKKEMLILNIIQNEFQKKARKHRHFLKTIRLTLAATLPSQKSQGFIFQYLSEAIFFSPEGVKC